MKRGELLALTLWRPWAWSVVTGAKRIENRGWRPPESLIGQRLAIHAGERWDDDAAAFLRAAGIDVPAKPAHVAGAILGVVTVRGALAPWDIDPTGQLRDDALHEAKVRRLTVRGYAAEQARLLFGPWGWLLSDAVALPSPVTARGKQRLWRVEPAAAAEVLAQL